MISKGVERLRGEIDMRIYDLIFPLLDITPEESRGTVVGLIRRAYARGYSDAVKDYPCSVVYDDAGGVVQE